MRTQAILEMSLLPYAICGAMNRFSDDLNGAGDEKRIIFKMTKEHGSVFKPEEYGL